MTRRVRPVTIQNTISIIYRSRKPFSLIVRGINAKVFTMILASTVYERLCYRIDCHNFGDTKKAVHDGFWQQLKVNGKLFIETEIEK